ncbi:MAG TPA: alpha/beta fold hydrolase [Gammaproteobacteria bacterium]|nr:alpha/beta fold hydrolase [Gammaproteobacteria bacterium]
MDDRRYSDQKHIDSELIGIVYEVAFDPNFWPGLLEGISHLFHDRRAGAPQPAMGADQQTQLFSSQLDETEKQRLATLLPHLYRALKLKQDYNDTDHSRGQAQAIIEQFPLGVLLVDIDGNVITSNQRALKTIAESNTLYLDGNRLSATAAKMQEQLAQLIKNAATAGLGDASACVFSLKIDDEGNETPLSLLITPAPYPATQFDQQAENCAAIFIGSASSGQHISATALQTLFGLSQAEARLASLLASGVSLSQAAEQSYISKNTAKVQLKSIFSKLGVNRQAELIKVILTSPAVINPSSTIEEATQPTIRLSLRSQINKEEKLRLHDGRDLSFAEFGDPHGIPVIYIHGILGCRYERQPDDLATRHLGIRLIIPDRPGYGLSDPAPNHGYLDFADDLLALMNHLDLERCSIMGLSVGAVYASALAYKAPQRLHRLAMISTTPPFRSFADFVDMPASLKLLVAFSKYLPSAAKMITETAIHNACKDPDKFLANIPVCPSDQAIFSHPILKDHIKHCLLAGNRHHQDGFIKDILLSAKPWPFPIADVRIPIDFWHGTKDTHSPLTRVQPVINAARNQRFFPVENGGHFLIYDYWQKILDTLLHQAQDPETPIN